MTLRVTWWEAVIHCTLDLRDKNANFAATYLSRETFHQDGDKQVEQNVVTERHKSYEVKRRPVTRLLHSVKQDDVPIFLGKDLSGKSSESLCRAAIFRTQVCARITRTSS